MNHERINIIALLDSFIEQINNIRKFLIGVSISSIILTPIAIVLTIFLVTHASFFKILEKESEFGLGLVILLSAVMVISSILFITGILQYKKIGSWHKKYVSFIKEKDDIDRYMENKFKMEISDHDSKQQEE